MTKPPPRQIQAQGVELKLLGHKCGFIGNLQDRRGDTRVPTTETEGSLPVPQVIGESSHSTLTGCGSQSDVWKLLWGRCSPRR